MQMNIKLRASVLRNITFAKDYVPERHRIYAAEDRFETLL